MESLAEVWYPKKDTNQIVHKIANIVITTMSSTSVKALCFLYIKNRKEIQYSSPFYKERIFIKKNTLKNSDFIFL